VAHRARPDHREEFPVHVTLRARAGLASLRSQRVFPAVREALRAASRDQVRRCKSPGRSEFRVVQFSVQADHIHLIVEASDRTALERGTRGMVIRTARAINRALGRSGSVWGDRYHARALRTPREVRHGLVYVLMNFRKHRPADRMKLDPCSSAPWFDGFLAAGGEKPASPAPPPAGTGRIRPASVPATTTHTRPAVPATTTATGPESVPVASARTWLGSVGWRRHGLIDPWEQPRPRSPVRPLASRHRAGLAGEGWARGPAW
jgi:putative transposase